MKITAKTRTQMHGYGIVQPHETIDIEENLIDGRIKANFTRADGEDWTAADGKTSDDKPKKEGKSAAKELIDRTAERMGREAIIAALQAGSIVFKSTENTASLAKKYLRSIGEQVD